MFHAKFDYETKVIDPAQRVWLIIRGKRHHISCEEVFHALFVPFVKLARISADDLSLIKEGSELIYGTRLVRGSASSTIYIQASFTKETVLHPIPSLVAFERYGFNMQRCVSVSDGLIARMKRGEALR